VSPPSIERIFSVIGINKEEVKACKILGNARSAGTHWRPMHHPKRVQLATRSANSSMLPVTYPTVATQEVIQDLDRDAVASQIRISNIEILNKSEIRITKCSKLLVLRVYKTVNRFSDNLFLWLEVFVLNFEF
jgi:hypothetical protein